MTLKQKMLTSLAAGIISVLAGCEICPVISYLGPEPYQKKHLSDMRAFYGEEITLAEMKEYYTQVFIHYDKFNREVQKRIDHAFRGRGEGALDDELSECDILTTNEMVEGTFKKYKHYKEKYPEFF